MPRPTFAGHNLVFILVDTLRADHLGSHGYERPTSPFLDGLAASGQRFREVRSQSPCTFPSANSLLTSRSVFRFLDPETRPGIPDGIPSIAEILQGRGYTTLAVSASPIVRASPSKHNPRGGFARGFDHFDESCEWREADCVTGRALEWLRERGREPFFLYLHYMDSHDPYRPPERFRGRFTGPYRGDDAAVARGDPNHLVRRLEAEGSAATVPAVDLRHLVDLYDEEILAADAGVRALFEGLERQGFGQRTLSVVTSDHGEGFLEHGRLKHCATLHEEQIRVPLIFSLPGIDPSAPSVAVRNLDVVPTLLDYLDIETDGLTLEGRTLRPLIETGSATALPALAAWVRTRAITDGGYKLIVDTGEKSFELYDLEADPTESRNLAGTRAATARRMWQQLEELLAREELDPSRRERLREVGEELRALGYL